MYESVKRLVCVALIGAAFAATEPVIAAFDNPKAKVPPRAKPQRRSAAEGLPPLPLPATPLRRTERKRQPAPPALVGMIRFSAGVRQRPDGTVTATGAFPTTQIDIEHLMRVANRKLNVRYRYVSTSFDKFSWKPSELPLLYVTGWTPIPPLGEAIITKLRRYLYDGGTLIFHAQCGRKEFNDSAVEAIARILPGRQLALLDSDSELFGAYYNIESMRLRIGSEPFKTLPPQLMAVYLGCRAAIIFSPYDLNCGWDVASRPIEGGILYHQDDAIKLGVNIITATLANLQYARTWGSKRVYHQQGQPTRDQLVIGQIQHGGDWDPTPHALGNLMKFIQANTTLNVQFKRETVDLADVNVFKHPVLYMTGLRDFTLTDAEVGRLRNYLRSGGMLVADAAAGRKAFDVAFRRELQRVLPEATLEPLPGESPIFRQPYAIRTVRYTELLQATQPQLRRPLLLAMTVDDRPAVIYCPLSLSNGWEPIEFPYSRGYAQLDALRLGVNLFTYALTH